MANRGFPIAMRVVKISAIIGLLGYGWLLIQAGIGMNIYSITYANVANNAIALAKGDTPIWAGSSNKGCNQLLLENCGSITTTLSTLHNEKVFLSILDAVRNPCHYLINPSKQEDMSDIEKKWQSHPGNTSNWELLKCSTGGVSNIKVVINIEGDEPVVQDERGFAKEGKIYLRVIKPAEG